MKNQHATKSCKSQDDAQIRVAYRIPNHVTRVAYSQSARIISLLSASLLSIALLIYPIMAAKTAQELNHTNLVLSLSGISSGFIHGVGFIPKSCLWRWVFSPYLAWALMLYSLYLWT